MRSIKKCALFVALCLVGALPFVVNQAKASALTADATVTSAGMNARSLTVTPSGAGIALAFVAVDGPMSGGQTAVVSGSIPWTLVDRENSQLGDAEIWSAPTNGSFSVSATPGISGFNTMLSVVNFPGASLGAVGIKAASSGTQNVAVAPMGQSSKIYGVGMDWDNAKSRTIGSGQTLVKQWMASTGDTYWVQSGSSVNALTDSSPTSDRWNYAAVEVIPAASSTTTAPTTAPATTTTGTPTTTVPVTTVPSTTIPPTTAPSTTTSSAPPAATSCPQFLTAASSPVAFCDPLSAPDPVSGTRSGQLNGVLWGVSRVNNNDNIGQGQSDSWASSSEVQCGTNVVVNSTNDMHICNGHLVESVNDTGYQTVLAAYPRQPFDFAGRTGTVEFDVTNNTQGVHGAWPSFAITDQPVPAPYGGGTVTGDPGSLSGVGDAARNSIGVDFDLQPNANIGASQYDPSCLEATIWATRNYQSMPVNTNILGCVNESTGADGAFNHVEVQVNSGGVSVYMSDAGSSTVRLISTASFAVPLTRGLAWMEDVHYNGGKFGNQQTNSFSWKNFAFDGPVVARDLGFDIPDNNGGCGTAENGLPVTCIGYTIPSGSPLTLNWANVVGSANASAGLLEFTFFPWNSQNFTYSVNGHAAHSFSWPYGSGGTFTMQTIALPIPASELQDGANSVKLSTSDGSGLDIANLDLILAGAGGIVNP